jgi:hypothetical protein
LGWGYLCGAAAPDDGAFEGKANPRDGFERIRLQRQDEAVIFKENGSGFGDIAGGFASGSFLNQHMASISRSTPRASTPMAQRFRHWHSQT